MSYYRKFGLVLGNPLFPSYLKWAYSRCLQDVKKLGLTPDLARKDFAALLCGCGNEQTAETFIEFILQKNQRPKIFIIDLGQEQIEAVERLVSKKYSELDIVVKQANALDLGQVVGDHSIDWIETDGFIEYFDRRSLGKLLILWKKILKKDGYVTTRDCVTEGFLTRVVDRLRLAIGKLWLRVTLFPHTRKELHDLFAQSGFKYAIGWTPVPTYKRISLVNNGSD